MNSSTSLFVYGTLMYPELFKLLTVRLQPNKVWSSESASIQDYHRCHLDMPDYNDPPILVAKLGSSVEGMVLHGLDDSILTLLDHYEMVHTGLYQRHSHKAKLSDGTIIQVQLYSQGPSAVCSDKTWDETFFLESEYNTYKTTVIPEFINDYFLYNHKELT